MKYSYKIFRILGKGALVLLVLFLFISILIQFPSVQTWVVQKITTNLSQTLATKVEIEKVNIKFFKTVSLQNIYIEDQQQDTLVFAEELDASIGLFSIIQGAIHLDQISLKNAKINIHRSLDDSLFNYQFIVDAFSKSDTQEQKKKSDGNGWDFSVENVLLQNVKMNVDDRSTNLELNADVGELLVGFETIDLKGQHLAFQEIALTNSWVDIKISQEEQDGLTQSQASKKDTASIKFPYVGWDFEVEKFEINNSELSIVNSKSKKTNTQLDVNNLALDIKKTSLEKFIWHENNLGAKIKTIEIKEKSGFNITDFSTSLQATPQKIFVENLKITTPVSQIQNTTELRFENFPSLINDFNNTIFAIDFSETKIASDDLKYLIAALGDLPLVDLSKNKYLQLKGKVVGTLNDFNAQQVDVEVENALRLRVEGMVRNITQPENMVFDLGLKELSTSHQKLSSIFKDVQLPEGLKQFGKFDLQGKLKGQVNNVDVEKLTLVTEANTGFGITGNIMGLPKIEDMILDLNIENVFTVADDIDGFVAADLPLILDTLGKISYHGNFKGSLTEFNLNGQLLTALGGLESDIFMDFNQDYSSAKYQGNLKLNEFQLGKFLGDSLEVGEVTLNADLEGEGFDLDSINSEVKVEVEKIEYLDYEYKNIFVDGLLREGVFNGALDLNDPNATLDFDGKISFKEEKPVYNFTMLVDTINLKELNMVQNSLGFHAQLNMDFQGDNLEDFEGRMSFQEIRINNQGEQFRTDSLEINAERVNPTQRSLTILSSFLSGEVKGNYNFRALPNMLISYFDDHYTLDNFLPKEKIIDAPEFIQKTQDFTFDFKIKDITPIGIFIPQLKQVDEASFTGKVDAENDKVYFDFATGKVVYDEVEFGNVKWEIIGDQNQIESQLLVSEIETSVGIKISQINLENSILNDSIYFAGQVKNDTIAQLLTFGANMSSKGDKNRIRLNPNIIINNNAWKIDPSNFLDFNTQSIEIDQLIFNNQKQFFGVQSLVENTEHSVAPINFSFQDFQIKELSKIANVENVNFEGLLNGNLKVIDVFENLHFNADLEIPEVVLNEESIGTLIIDLEQLMGGEKIDVNILLKGGANDVAIKGNYDIKQTEYHVSTNIASLQFRLIDPLMVGILKESEGKINGAFTLDGNPNQLEILGELNLDQVSTTIEFSKTRYTINEGQIKFDQKSIDLGTLLLVDQRGDQATLSGKLNHDFFSDLTLDLEMNTDQFTFLNTEASDNELFFGKLFLHASATITGPLETPLVEVTAKTLENSILSVSAFAEEENLLEEDFIIFGNPTTLASKEQNDSKNIYEIQNTFPADIRLNLELTDDAIFRVIVDPLTGDQLEAKGNAALLINMLPTGEMTIFGNYIIQSGQYDFSYTDIFKRNFAIEKGSSVNFNGDLFDARFNVTAKHIVEATPFDLIRNEATIDDDDLAEAQERQKVEVLMKMDGNILKPALTFDLQLPDSEATVINSEVQRKLVELRNDPNELNKQVFGLLIFRGFIVSSGGASFGSTGEAVFLGNMSQFISNQLNQLADKYIKGVKVNFDVKSYQSQYANDGAGANVTELGVGVTKEINDRLSLKAGGNIDVNSNEEAIDFSQIAGDFVLEYKLTDSGNYLLKVFRRSDYDTLREENSVKTGIGISINKSFGGVKKN